MNPSCFHVPVADDGHARSTNIGVPFLGRNRILKGTDLMIPECSFVVVLSFRFVSALLSTFLEASVAFCIIVFMFET